MILKNPFRTYINPDTKTIDSFQLPSNIVSQPLRGGRHPLGQHPGYGFEPLSHRHFWPCIHTHTHTYFQTNISTCFLWVNEIPLYRGIVKLQFYGVRLNRAFAWGFCEWIFYHVEKALGLTTKCKCCVHTCLITNEERWWFFFWARKFTSVRLYLK